MQGLGSGMRRFRRGGLDLYLPRYHCVYIYCLYTGHGLCNSEGEDDEVEEGEDEGEVEEGEGSGVRQL